MMSLTIFLRKLYILPASLPTFLSYPINFYLVHSREGISSFDALSVRLSKKVAGPAILHVDSELKSDAPCDFRTGTL